ASQTNLKQIGLALHNFHDNFGYLPGGIYGPDGKPGLSWRVAILPYIEQDVLFRQFKLDEPWDSEHNKKLIEKMPKQYASPTGSGEPGTTFYRGFTGQGTVMDLRQSGRPGAVIPARRFTDITDGTSNTLIVAEAAEAVIWTKPDELAFSPSGPLPKLGG